MRILLLFTLLIPYALFADSIPVVNDPTIYDGIIDTFTNSAKSWEPVFTKTSLYIFYVLASIQLAWEFGTMAARGEFEFGGEGSALIRTIVIFGMFKFLLVTPDIFITWFNSFNKLADLANQSTGIHTANLFGSAGTLFKLATDGFSILDFTDAFGLMLIAVLGGILLVLISVELLITIIKFYFSLYLNIIILGFAPLAVTRQWPINGIINMLKIGMEVLVLKLIVGLSISTIAKYTLDLKENSNDDSLIYLFILVITLFSLAKMTHGMVESFFNGYGTHNNHAGVQVAKGMIGGAMGGTMASINNHSSNSNTNSSQTSNTNNTSSTSNPMLPKNDASTSSSVKESLKSVAEVGSVMGTAVVGGVAGGIGGATRAAFGHAPKDYTNGYREATQDSKEDNKPQFNTEYKLGDNKDD